MLTPQGEIITLTVDELELDYRTSIVKVKDYIVLEAVIRLETGDASQIKAVMDDLRNKRVEKQPLEYPSAGSTFKRPEGHLPENLSWMQDFGDIQLEEPDAETLWIRGKQRRRHCSRRDAAD